MTEKGNDPTKEMSGLLDTMRSEVKEKAKHRPIKEGIFRAVLKASFARIFEYVEFAHLRLSNEHSDAFFGSAPLRQSCEDLIALKFLMQLKRKDRDAVVQALMIVSTSKALEKQSVFFKLHRQYQPILNSWFPPDKIERSNKKLDEIGTRTQLWHTQKKLPPIEQMARKVGLLDLYEFLYAATSEIVHFNVRIALRSGWGEGNEEFSFSPSNFSKYYQLFAKIYSAYLLLTFCRTFHRALTLSPHFMNAIDSVEVLLESKDRWPEIVTFEEMNVRQNDNIILRALLAMKRDERTQELRSKHEKRRLKTGRPA